MTVTESVVALPSGSAVRGSERLRASAGARVKGSVTRRDRVRAVRAARVVAGARRIGRVMYLDAADSWIVRESTPSIRQVWSTDYAALTAVDWAPFRVWCRVWKPIAVGSAAVLDSTKFFLIHPVRGPLFLTAAGAGITVAVL